MERDRYSLAVGWLGAAIVALVVAAGVATVVNQGVSLAFLVLCGISVGVLAGLAAPPRQLPERDAAKIIIREAARAAVERHEQLAAHSTSSESQQRAQKDLAIVMRLAGQLRGGSLYAKRPWRRGQRWLQIEKAIDKLEEMADSNNEMAIAAAVAARRAQAGALQAGSLDTPELSGGGWTLAALGVIAVGIVLATTTVLSFRDRIGFAEGLVVTGAVTVGWMLASAGLPRRLGAPASMEGDRQDPGPADGGGGSRVGEQEPRVGRGGEGGKEPGRRRPVEQPARALAKARIYIADRGVPPGLVMPLLALFAALALLVLGGLVAGVVDLLQTETHTASTVVGALFLLAPIALLGGALMAPEGKRTPWLLGTVATACIGPFAATVIGDVNELVHKKLSPECLSAQVQAAQIVSFAQAGTLLSSDGEAVCAKGLWGLHEKQAQVLDVAGRSPECVAVLAQLDELADDEPRLGREALAHEDRVCQLLHGGRATDSKLLDELARR